jgi:hypothetical protein
MAASASSACWSSCGVAGMACFPAADEPAAVFPLLAELVPTELVPAELAPADRDFAAAVAAAGRSPLLTKPCTPSELSEREYSCALTEKLGSESPPMVESTPPE